MCNDCSNNLDHFWAGKIKRFGSRKDKACFLCDKHYKITGSIGCEENSITICY